MSLTSQEVTLLGVAVASLGYVSRGLLSLLEKKMAPPPVATLTEEQVKRIVGKAVAGLDSEISELQGTCAELIRMHRDPNSIFATTKLSGTTNEIHRIVSVLEKRGE